MTVREKMAEQLGMNPSTASSALKKQIMYTFAGKLGLDICYQCGEKIQSVKDFSVEHKKPWLHSEDPVGLFLT